MTASVVQVGPGARWEAMENVLTKIFCPFSLTSGLGTSAVSNNSMPFMEYVCTMRTILKVPNFTSSSSETWIWYGVRSTVVQISLILHSQTNSGWTSCCLSFYQGQHTAGPAAKCKSRLAPTASNRKSHPNLDLFSIDRFRFDGDEPLRWWLI